MPHEKLTSKDLMDLEAQRKDKEGQEEEITEEPKRFITQEIREFSLLGQALLVFETQRMRWLYSITNSVDTNLSRLQEMLEDRGTWHAVVQGAAKSWTQFSD